MMADLLLSGRVPTQRSNNRQLQLTGNARGYDVVGSSLTAREQQRERAMRAMMPGSGVWDRGDTRPGAEAGKTFRVVSTRVETRGSSRRLLPVGWTRNRAAREIAVRAGGARFQSKI